MVNVAENQGPLALPNLILPGAAPWLPAQDNFTVLEEYLSKDWSDWTPTYSNFTIGNGTATARYMQIGKVVWFYFNWVWGSTSSIDGANATISAPVEADSNYPDADMPLGVARYQETGTAARMGYVRLETTTTLRPVVNSATATYVRDAGITSTVPFTWGNTDVMSFQGFYAAA